MLFLRLGNSDGISMLVNNLAFSGPVRSLQVSFFDSLSTYMYHLNIILHFSFRNFSYALMLAFPDASEVDY